MLIRIGYKIAIEVDQPTPLYTLMNVHPERENNLRWVSPIIHRDELGVARYVDAFGNTGLRLTAPVGVTMLRYDAVIDDPAKPDVQNPDAGQMAPQDLPDECMRFLLGSRYCETDKLADLAWRLFGDTKPGWARVQAICDYVNFRLNFSYGFARATRTAAEAHEERVGVCRDFAHLAITFCRALNIPARYVNGYLGDIGIEPDPAPMDFSAWFEAYLGGRWYAFDARHNVPRAGRIVVARGRDATDVPLLHTFGPHKLHRFEVWSEPYEGDLPSALPRIRHRQGSGRYGPPGRSPRDFGQGERINQLL